MKRKVPDEDLNRGFEVYCCLTECWEVVPAWDLRQRCAGDPGDPSGSVLWAAGMGCAADTYCPLLCIACDAFIYMQGVW